MSWLFSLLEDLRANVRVADVIDIFVIAVLIYFGLTWARRKTSRPVIVGIAALSLLYFLARRLEMLMTSLLFQAGLTALLVALVLVFQDDLRRMFDRLAAWGVPNPRPRQLPDRGTIETVVESVSQLASRKIGALIVLKGKEPLERHTRGGVSVGGRPSLPLLHSIFHPASPGHDGAVVIDGDVIRFLGVHLPLSRNPDAAGGAGTRHAAALGLSECCDSLVIVVSEERGTVSVAEHGELQLIDRSRLHARIEEFYRKLHPEGERPAVRWLGGNLGLKTTAVVLASVLWLLFAFRVETVQRTLEVPIEYRNVAADWVVGEPLPTRASVTLSGSARVFDLLDPASVVISLDLRDVPATQREVQIGESNVRRPSGLSVSEIDPAAIRLRKPAPRHDGD